MEEGLPSMLPAGRYFRANVKGGTLLAIEAGKYIDNGDFVPDSVTNNMVCDRLSETDVESGFLLDGCPRTTAQADYLDEVLAEGEEKLDVVLQLTADDEELVHRLLGRAKETGRSDDNEAVIRPRAHSVGELELRLRVEGRSQSATR